MMITLGYGQQDVKFVEFSNETNCQQAINILKQHNNYRFDSLTCVPK